MKKLTGTLGDYVTVGMALDMLGHGREQTSRFYNLVAKGLRTYKIGGMTLARASEFAELAGLPAGTKPAWPAELASLQLADVCSRNEAAEQLSVSPRTINRYANIGKINAYDLSPWGGYTLYEVNNNYHAVSYMGIGDWLIEARMDNGKLEVALANEDAYTYIGHSQNSHPTKVFIYADDIEPAVATFRVTNKL